MRSSVIAAVILTLGLSTARADRASEAREHYQSATAHFAVGEFAEAATEYQAAFKLKPDPALLYNAAQSYRLANNHEKALILYKNYLQLYPNEANADEVRRQVEKVKEAIAAAERAKTSPPTGTSEPKQLPAATEPVQPTTPPSTVAPQARSEVAATAPAKPEKTPVYKKWWLWTIVGVVVAGGVATAVVLTTRHDNWANEPTVGPGVASHTLVQW